MKSSLLLCVALAISLGLVLVAGFPYDPEDEEYVVVNNKCQCVTVTSKFVPSEENPGKEILQRNIRILVPLKARENISDPLSPLRTTFVYRMTDLCKKCDPVEIELGGEIYKAQQSTSCDESETCYTYNRDKCYTSSFPFLYHGETKNLLKRSLLLLLLLLLLTAAAYGAWYFYPYGLSTHNLPAFPWWGAGKLSSPDMPGTGDLTTLDQGHHRLLARFQALEKRFEVLEAEMSRWELRRGAAAVAAGGEPPPGDVLALLEGLLSRRDAGLKEHLRTDMNSHLQGELDALRAEVRRDLDGRLGKMAQTSQEMETRLLQLNSEWQSSVQESLRGKFQQEVGKLEQEVAALRRELAGLKSDQEVMGKHMEGMLEQLKAVRADVEAQFPAWVSQFLSQSRRDGTAGLVLQQEDLQVELQALERKILDKVLEDRRLSARDAGIGVALRQGGTTGVTEEQVHLIVDQALKRYSEDRVGMVDYALESAGASVINTRCSETYETRTALLSLFGIPLWYHSQSPRVILQPDVNPGNCWAFRGSQGFAVIRLSSIIRPTAVTLEHIPKALSPNGTIPSAPKDFAVYGLKEEGEEEGLLLGQFTYNHNGNPIQTFYFEDDTIGTYQLVELRVLSNWGHLEYTCIYRFRVHGEPAH